MNQLHGSFYLTCIITRRRTYYLYDACAIPRYTDGETELQRYQISCSRSRREYVGTQGVVDAQ